MPKNPNIAKFFREIGLADELGSGMRNLMKYGQAYGGEVPLLLEGDVFRMVVHTPENQATLQVTPQNSPQDSLQVEAELYQLLQIMGESSHTRTELMEQMGLSDRKNFRNRYLQPLLEQGLIQMTIPDKPNSRNQKYRLTPKGKGTQKGTTTVGGFPTA
jgi:ATP-dependent DNA helicase RecG